MSVIISRIKHVHYVLTGHSFMFTSQLECTSASSSIQPYGTKILTIEANFKWKVKHLEQVFIVTQLTERELLSKCSLPQWLNFGRMCLYFLVGESSLFLPRESSLFLPRELSLFLQFYSPYHPTTCQSWLPRSLLKTPGEKNLISMFTSKISVDTISGSCKTEGRNWVELMENWRWKMGDDSEVKRKACMNLDWKCKEKREASDSTLNWSL